MNHRTLHGDNTALLPTLEAGSVQMILTSPPYFGLRDYGIPPTDWPEVRYSPMAGLPEVTIPSVSCCLGLESTPEAYVGHLVHVFRLARRVLRDDGCAWLNLGDSFAANRSYQVPDSNWGDVDVGNRMASSVPTGLKPKDLLGIPWRTAFALQADGWFLRSDIVWAKGVSCLPDYAGSCMPEPVRDRPVRGHEMVFLLAKRARYFYDAETVKEKAQPMARVFNGGHDVGADRQDNNRTNRDETTTRNLRSVWAISPEPSPVEHYAMMPSRLAALMIRAGTSERGACPVCGSPWERITERVGGPPPGDHRKRGDLADCKTAHPTGTVAGSALWEIYREHGVPETRTIGWQAACPCPPAPPVPCVVLDPFGGAGTTGKTAARLGRSSVLIELHAKHAAHATHSAGSVAPLFNQEAA